MNQWYYGSSVGQTGPVDENELRALIASGGVGPETLVWRDGMKDWLPLRSVQELALSPPPVSSGPTHPSQMLPQPPAGYAQGYYPPVVPTSGLAIASMVCGIVGMITCYFAGIFGIPAVICGHMALNQINTSAVPRAGKGMAIAGLVMGYLGILASVAAVAFFVIAIGSANF